MDTDDTDHTDRQRRSCGAVLRHRELTHNLIRVFYDVYNERGAGFVESVYQAAFDLALADAGITAIREAPLEIFFRGRPVGFFRPDFVVEGVVLLELKA